MLQFTHLESELQNYKNDLIQLYNSKMGNDRHTLQIEIQNPSKGVYNVVIVGPEEIQFIENGRGPGGFPPVDKLQEWVKEKLHETELPRVQSLAFLIGRKIAIYGTQGNHLIEECVAELNDRYEPRLKQAQKDDTDVELKRCNDMLINICSTIF